jgi:hypothetical protein
MGLEKTFRELTMSLHRLSDRLQELQLTVVEDRPAKNDASLVDGFAYAVDDAIGWLREMQKSAKTAQLSVAYPRDLDQARRELVNCQEQFKRIERVFSQKLVSWERMSELSEFANERRGEWRSWVFTVQRGVEHCRQPIEETSTALASCWEEIAERVGMTSVTMQTNITPASVRQIMEEPVEDQ